MISDYELAQLTELLKDGRGDLFYSRASWLRVRGMVLKLDNYECQYCKARGRYSRAVIVHHVKHLRDRPDLALSVYDGGRRQLVSCCKRCHEEQHPESFSKIKTSSEKFETEERWD